MWMLQWLAACRVDAVLYLYVQKAATCMHVNYNNLFKCCSFLAMPSVRRNLQPMLARFISCDWNYVLHLF